jgi:hypothetical protein
LLSPKPEVLVVFILEMAKIEGCSIWQSCCCCIILRVFNIYCIISVGRLLIIAVELAENAVQLVAFNHTNRAKHTLVTSIEIVPSLAPVKLNN